MRKDILNIISKMTNDDITLHIDYIQRTVVIKGIKDVNIYLDACLYLDKKFTKFVFI